MFQSSFRFTYVLMLLGILMLGYYCTGQGENTTEESTVTESPFIRFRINENIQNADEDYAKEIIQLWKDYLSSYRYVNEQNEYWSYETLPAPDYPYISLLLDLINARNNEEVWNCNIIGITAVENDFKLLKSMFTQVDSNTQEVRLKYIVSVYAKETDTGYRLHSGSDYHKQTLENIKVGNINYVVHPNHTFDVSVAKKMDQFNTRIANQFGVEPISFDYFVANHTDDLSQMMAYDFFSFSYQPVRTGGLADNYNNIILSGNNSEYYPHEVVHLYTNAIKNGRKNFLVDEGIATFLGGSSGYRLDWHIQKFKVYLEAHPEFRFDNIFELKEKYIPNGEYLTDFKYVIGGFIIKKIHEKHGMEGVKRILETGYFEADYFQMVEDELGIYKRDFENYIREEIKKIELVDKNELDQMLVQP